MVVTALLWTPNARELAPAASTYLRKSHIVTTAHRAPDVLIGRFPTGSLAKALTRFTASPASTALIEIAGAVKTIRDTTKDLPNGRVSIIYTTVQCSEVGGIYGFGRSYQLWQKEEAEDPFAPVPNDRPFNKWRQLCNMGAREESEIDRLRALGGGDRISANGLSSSFTDAHLQTLARWEAAHTSMPPVLNRYNEISQPWLNWSMGLPPTQIALPNLIPSASNPYMARMGWGRCLNLGEAATNTHSMSTLF